MNERIKELAMQNERIWNLYTIGPVQRAEVEDFVEAIVRECINCNKPLIKYYIDAHPEQEQTLLLASISDYASEIKKHFGIEE